MMVAWWWCMHTMQLYKDVSKATVAHIVFVAVLLVAAAAAARKPL